MNESCQQSDRPAATCKTDEVGGSDSYHLVIKAGAWCRVEAVRTGNLDVVRMHGELEAYSSSIVRAAIFEFLDGCDETRIELGCVTFIDSAGGQLLEQCCERLERRAAHCELRDPTPAVELLFDLVGIDGLIAPVDHGGRLCAGSGGALDHNQ